MSFYLDMQAKYAPDMSPLQFSIVMNSLERDLFDLHPEYLRLEERDQNRLVETFYKERYGNS